jgi:peroxiredoxin (alkyl hydroperoxide reductase subunit C)
MRHALPLVGVGLLLGALASAAPAQHRPGGHHGTSPSEALPAGETRTLKPGMPAPDFALVDHEGTVRRLADYRGRRHVLLVFYMGEWCMGCMSQLTELAHANRDFVQRGVQIVAVSVDGRERALIAANRLSPGEKSPFPVLADPERKAVAAYGVLQRHFVYRDGSKHENIAFHTELLIDRAGVIRSIKTGWVMPVDFPRVPDLLAEFSSFPGS